MPATIFNSGTVKLLKDILRFKSGTDIISTTINPLTTGYAATIGSILLKTNTYQVFKKIGATNTDWAELNHLHNSFPDLLGDAADDTAGEYYHLTAAQKAESTRYVSLSQTGLFTPAQYAAHLAKEDVSNKSTNTALGSSTTLYPAQGAVKAYVDARLPDINYCTNGWAYSDTSGFSVYVDIGDRPVDGVGGSPEITLLTRDSTNSLRGSYNFLITKDATNRRGYGVAWEFEIAPADEGQPITVEFSYDASTGFSWTNKDLTVWAVCVGTGEVIYLTPGDLDASGKFVGSFQTRINADKTYRICWHIGTVNATAWTFKFTDIFIGYKRKVVGNWQEKAYDMTITADKAAFVTQISEGVLYKTRDGRWRLRFNIRGTFTSTTATSISIVFTGVKFSALTYQIVNAVTSNNTLVTAYTNPNVDYITVTFSSMTVDRIVLAGDVSLAEMPTWGVDYYPIELGHEADTRNVGCDVYLNTLTAISPNTNSVKIPFDSIEKDTHLCFDNANDRYVIPIDGWYNISARILISNQNLVTGGFYSMDVHIDGVFALKGEVGYPVSGYGLYLQTNGAKYLRKGQYVEVFFYAPYNHSVLQLFVYATSTGVYNAYTNFQVVRSPGPALVQAHETIYALYRTGAGPNFTTAGAICDYSSKVQDTHAAVTTGASWKFTAPRSCPYTISFSHLMAYGAYTTSFILRATIVVNGTTYLRTHRVQQAANLGTHFFFNSTATIWLNKGNYFHIFILPSSGGTTTLYPTADDNWISIISR